MITLINLEDHITIYVLDIMESTNVQVETLHVHVTDVASTDTFHKNKTMNIFHKFIHVLQCALLVWYMFISFKIRRNVFNNAKSSYNGCCSCQSLHGHRLGIKVFLLVDQGII